MADIIKRQNGIEVIGREVKIGEKDQLRATGKGSRNRRTIVTELLQLKEGEGVIRGKEGHIKIVNDKERISAALFEIPNFKFGDFKKLADLLLEEEDEEMQKIFLAKIAKEFPLRFELVKDDGYCLCLECDELWKSHRVEIRRIEKGGKISFFCPKTGRETAPYILPKVNPYFQLHLGILSKFQQIAAGLMIATIEILRFPSLLASVK